MKKIPFNKPALTGSEIDYIQTAHAAGHLAGDGAFSRQCHGWLEQKLGAKKALLTHSCTAALEMAALLLEISEGDEVIMPSYTFVSTANAFVLRGATPVFVDVKQDDFNIDERLIERAITEKTRAIVPVHYAGVACDMPKIQHIANQYKLAVVEDAAQGVLSKSGEDYLGTIGTLGTLSFHETKNLISGEGGALLINDEQYQQRAEIIREKGTNRSSFFRGEVNKYSWVDIGSSYLPSELIAAFLWAQLEQAEELTRRRRNIWHHYHSGFEYLEEAGYVVRPKVGGEPSANAHIYYLIMPSEQIRQEFIEAMKLKGIHCVFHYLPLHSSPMGKQIGRIVGDMSNTELASQRLVRLPLWIGVEEHLDYIIDSAVEWVLSRLARQARDA